MFWNDVKSRVYVTTSEVVIVHFPITEKITKNWDCLWNRIYALKKIWDGVCAKFLDLFVLYYLIVIDVPTQTGC